MCTYVYVYIYIYIYIYILYIYTYDHMYIYIPIYVQYSWLSFSIILIKFDSSTLWYKNQYINNQEVNIFFRYGLSLFNTSFVQWPIGSMYAVYGNIYHQYTPFMLVYIPAPWMLWVITFSKRSEDGTVESPGGWKVARCLQLTGPKSSPFRFGKWPFR